ncbi:MAG: zinc-ribbon domain-containing protein [Roseburia sp.]|nr:zinc-ribbon domain-containing protein [Roseburia sp.]
MRIRRKWGIIGFNDLATTHPQLVKEWHPTKNGNVKPIDVSAGSNKKVWWLYSYDDPKTGKHFDFEWQAIIHHRANGIGCPLIRSSRMERLTYDFLKKMKLNFKTEKKFSKCQDQKSLPFDVYLSDKNKIIELDGVQHFRGIDAWGGDNQLTINKKHDEIKDNFCFENNIPLLRIPYIYDADNDKKEIEDIIHNFIEDGVVPDKIKDFYEEEGRVTYITLLEKMSN